MNPGEGPLGPELRRVRTKDTLSRMRVQLGEWSAPWSRRREHDSQLTLLLGSLDKMLAELSTRADNVGSDAGTYRRCQALDFDLAFVERIWKYYKDRLDQRADTSGGVTGPAEILRAADDVIWSCYELASAMDPARRPPLPLAFFDAAFSANAPPRDAPPSGLKPRDRVLAEMISEMPIPLIALPSNVAFEPWWLAVVPHEAGHHIQYDLEADKAVVSRVGDLLDQHGGSEWQAWRYEVFADAFAVAAIGPESIAVLAELEWAELDAMSADRGAYPPVIVRLAIASELAARLGHPASAYVVDRWRPQLAAIARASDRTRVADALDRVLGTTEKPGLAADLAALVVGKVALADVTGRTTAADLDATVVDSTAYAYEKVLAGTDRVLRRGRRASRLTAAAAFRAFRQRVAPAEKDRADADGFLRERTLMLFEKVRDTTSKRASIPEGQTAELAASLLGRAARARNEEGW